MAHGKMEFRTTPMRAHEPLRTGDFVWLLPNGMVGRAQAHQGFSRIERAVRRLGRLLKNRRMASYRERPILGFALHDTAPGEMVKVAVANVRW